MSWWHFNNKWWIFYYKVNYLRTTRLLLSCKLLRSWRFKTFLLRPTAWAQFLYHRVLCPQPILVTSLFPLGHHLLLRSSFHPIVHAIRTIFFRRTTTMNKALAQSLLTGGTMSISLMKDILPNGELHHIILYLGRSVFFLPTREFFLASSIFSFDQSIHMELKRRCWTMMFSDIHVISICIAHHVHAHAHAPHTCTHIERWGEMPHAITTCTCHMSRCGSFYYFPSCIYRPVGH